MWANTSNLNLSPALFSHLHNQTSGNLPAHKCLLPYPYWVFIPLQFGFHLTSALKLWMPITRKIPYCCSQQELSHPHLTVPDSQQHSALCPSLHRKPLSSLRFLITHTHTHILFFLASPFVYFAERPSFPELTLSMLEFLRTQSWILFIYAAFPVVYRSLRGFGFQELPYLCIPRRFLLKVPGPFL